MATVAPSPALAPLALLLLLLFLLLLLLLLQLLLLFLLLVQLLLLLQASPIREIMFGRPQEALKIRRASGPAACQNCASTGTESAASRSEEEAKGIVYRAVEAKDSKWLGVKN